MRNSHSIFFYLKSKIYIFHIIMKENLDFSKIRNENLSKLSQSLSFHEKKIIYRKERMKIRRLYDILFPDIESHHLL